MFKYERKKSNRRKMKIGIFFKNCFGLRTILSQKKNKLNLVVLVILLHKIMFSLLNMVNFGYQVGNYRSLSNSNDRMWGFK